MSYFWPKKGLVGPNLQQQKNNSDIHSAFKATYFKTDIVIPT